LSPPLLRCRGGAIAANDREIDELVLMKLAHRAGKNLVDKVVDQRRIARQIRVYWISGQPLAFFSIGNIFHWQPRTAVSAPS
jgi:hypothetical protein